MIPIEIAFWVLVTLFGAIGFIRGWSKEVGTTTGLVLAMLILNRFGGKMITFINKFSGAMGVAGSLIADAPSFSRFFLFTIVFLVVAFISYHGETLALSKKASGITESILGLFIGLIDGYLIAGNLWFYLHEQQYLLASGLFTVPTSDTARFMIKLLPPNIMMEPVLFILLVLLLLLRIIK
jgi:uncharacterized membrane protein required for colicin V production